MHQNLAKMYQKHKKAFGEHENTAPKCWSKYTVHGCCVTPELQDVCGDCNKLKCGGDASFTDILSSVVCRGT